MLRAPGRTALLAGLLVGSAGALGLLAPPAAAAGCVAPQLRVVSRNSPSPSAAASGVEPAPVTVTAGQAITVEAAQALDVRDGCGDPGPGCSGSASAGRGARGVSLVAEQGGRSWVLGTADARGPRRTARYVTALPASMSSGPAELVLRGGGVTETRLRVIVG